MIRTKTTTLAIKEPVFKWDFEKNIKNDQRFRKNHKSNEKDKLYYYRKKQPILKLLFQIPKN